MATDSMDQVRSEHIAAMGQELGVVFNELYRKLVQLHLIWKQYRQLYGEDPETIHLLNRTAGLFFKIVQDELWDSVLLGISRLTDPPETGSKTNKKINLTVQSLPPLIADSTIRAEVKALCEKAVNSAAFARDHRNKRIAHQDHNYLTDQASNPMNGISRALVEEMLESLRAILNRLDRHYRDTTFMYERFVDHSGARLLVYKLQQLEHLQSSSSGAP